MDDKRVGGDLSAGEERRVQVFTVAEEEAVPDAVFGEVVEGGTNYNTLGWFQTSILLMKTQIGLGVLSIPYVLSVFGAVPGVILLLAVSVITTWADLECGRFKLAHPECYSLSDVGFLIGGVWGRELFGVSYYLYQVCVVGSAFIGMSTALNAVSTHATCTATFIGSLAIAAIILSSTPTLRPISIASYVGLVCILSAILVVAVAVNVQERPAGAPSTGPWDKQLLVVGNPSFQEAMLALSNLVFSFSGTPSFLPIASEMKNPRQFKKAALLCQGVVTSFIGIMVYYACGIYVSSPALGSAGPLLKKISYGIAIPGLLVTMTICTHLPAKWLMLRLLRGTPHLTANTVRHWVTWEGCVVFCVLISYIFASAIANFSTIIGLIGALLGTFLCMQAMALMRLYDEARDVKAGRRRNWRLTSWCLFVLAVGTFITVAGTYASIVSIVDIYQKDPGSAWSCDDNSNSV
ncbi:transmembrane amino acid transporter protein-domain-containing protein [Leucosporidium creatinivorum]|uniref:Transmembrane amino acid transporter protein-domain-containing protein n=1 Tax=Leucosporidium creatinivorum TaxID=106004 RepID=A0A1Y2FYZ6_9BASI|nr:transmembrane amino acid transporter protein-domain-containing protein [Leucosporidium creatinivorum]